jgi:hypothetical protein
MKLGDAFPSLGNPVSPSEPKVQPPGPEEVAPSPSYPVSPPPEEAAEASPGEIPEPVSPFPSPVGPRDFLSRPVGQEDNLDPWAAWAPFLSRLKKADPEQFDGIEEAETALQALEASGLKKGSEYEAAVALLFLRFETARRWVWRQEVKVWIV